MTSTMASSDPVVDIRSAADAVSVSTDDAFSSATPLHEIESLCMRCGENGTTRLLLTRIPFFREVVLMAFECPHCNERNNEVQFAGQLQPKGCCYTLHVQEGDRKILNRQVVKSDSATIKIPELNFEIPPEAQRGTLSTVEGVLLRAVDELQALQEERKKLVPDTAEAIDQFLRELKSLASGHASFTFILDDPSGNSFIENPYAPLPDSSVSVRLYERTPEQQKTLGFLVDPSIAEEHERRTDSNISTEEDNNVSNINQNAPHGSIGAIAGRRAIAQGNSDQIATALCRYSAPEEVNTLPSSCLACGAACTTNFYQTKIPYFQEVIIMAATCDLCGYKNSELKPGGEIPIHGKKITVRIETPEDLNRDVIKSDSASVKVPELDLELESGTLGGIVTTVEGLITQIVDKLGMLHGFSFGDSLDDWSKQKWQDFKSRLAKLLSLEEPWTLIIDDAMASSFVAPTADAIEDDKRLIIEEYERTWEQNEQLGLNDMDTSSADNAYQTATDQ